VEGSDAFDVGFHRVAIQISYPAHWARIDIFEFEHIYDRQPTVVDLSSEYPGCTHISVICASPLVTQGVLPYGECNPRYN
jgi:hypothetical protein